MKSHFFAPIFLSLAAAQSFASDCSIIIDKLSKVSVHESSYAQLSSFPRAPKAFIDWWKKLNFIEGNNRPFTQAEFKNMTSILTQTMMEKFTSKSDPFAASSWPHIEQHLHHADLFKGHIQSMGVDPDYYRLLALSHDIGKFVPDAEVLKLANGNFLLGRVAWHDQSTAAFLLKLGENQHIKTEKIEHLIADIIGHNDGSGLKDVFWNSVYPDYDLPRRLEGDLLTLFDRFGQGDWVGAMKIAKQQLAASGFGPALIEEAYLKNPTNTMRQLEVIYLRASERLKDRKVGVLPTAQKNLDEIYHYALNAQKETIEGHRKLQWDEGKKAFKLSHQGQVYWAHNLDEFMSDSFQLALQK